MNGMVSGSDEAVIKLKWGAGGVAIGDGVVREGFSEEVLALRGPCGDLAGRGFQVEGTVSIRWR